MPVPVVDVFPVEIDFDGARLQGGVLDVGRVLILVVSHGETLVAAGAVVGLLVGSGEVVSRRSPGQRWR